MIAAGIVIAIIILIALLRVGVCIEYSADGFEAAVRVGPISKHVFPVEEKPGDAEKKALKKARKKEKVKKKKKPKKKMPGGIKPFLDMIPPVKNTLGRLRRRLLIKRLTIHYYPADDDPAKTAMLFGAANAVFGAITPMLDNTFRIKRRDLRAFPNFAAFEQTIYAKAIISLAVWEAVYIVFALLPILKIIFGRKQVTQDRKENDENGKAPDK